MVSRSGSSNVVPLSGFLGMVLVDSGRDLPVEVPNVLVEESTLVRQQSVDDHVVVADDTQNVLTHHPHAFFQKCNQMNYKVHTTTCYCSLVPTFAKDMPNNYNKTSFFKKQLRQPGSLSVKKNR